MRREFPRLTALYLLFLLLAAAFAPHHHLDPIADLFSDRPSNSGTFVRIDGPGSLDAGVYPASLVEDESCLACFQSDFGGAPAVALGQTPALTLVALRPVLPSPSAPTAFPSDTASRAPPSAA